MHPYMYMGRFVPKEGQNREKVTFYFVDTQELQPQPFKKDIIGISPAYA